MPATIEETVKVDSKGRITIPIAVRELFDIREGMYMLIIADKESREIKLVPLPVAARLAKLKLLVEDRTGVLAELTRFIASHNVDIVSTKCVVLKREELGECEMIIDISKTGWSDPSIIIENLKKLEPVKNVELAQLNI
ncbi:MAG: ACT domain-containing protein [Desulfurococcus sp.]|jgi:AbrB family looped-hinge helix DNA binding protein|uniref:Transcriptional regulator, AbrB family n=1 Tax=Desulfurococcus amylolyticus DSM 16532 TaxID=768672 RepID=I3XTC2_DESAM|nr:ACT domain-containing protein [Desulfurococcus amylolyticus]AFL67196.1 transcriptional regulator, AbrB family [Desulfurococcus amylolyticus DSM 16532]